jgi:hypothetical protein
MSLPRFAARSYEFTEYVPARNWIGGEWASSAGDAPRLEVPNPRWGRAMSSVALSSAAEVENVILAVRLVPVNRNRRPASVGARQAPAAAAGAR